MEGRVISIRKPVSLAITLHGTRFILVEFGLGTPFIFGVALFLLMTRQPLLSSYLFLTGFNYVPLVVYAILVTMRGSSEDDVRDDLAADKHYVRKYSIQQLLVFAPLAIVAIALWQYADGDRTRPSARAGT